MPRKILKIVVTLGVCLALISAAPEVVMLYTVIEAIGFDVFVMLCEAQLIAVFYAYFGQHALQFFRWVNSRLEKLDPYYFIPSRALIRQCPSIAFHTFPFLVSGIMVLTVGASIYG